jgi:hypothetical protein
VSARAIAAALFAFLAGAGGPAAAQSTNDHREIQGNASSDWEERERRAREDGINLPAPPRKDDEVEFWVSNSTQFRFFIDTASISVGKDDVVRYTFIARSPSGVENISYEGMRCKEGTYRIYANLNDGKWAPRTTEWKAIEPNAIARWHNELRLRYFCANRRGALLTKEEGVDALRRGGHPGAAARAGY